MYITYIVVINSTNEHSFSVLKDKLYDINHKKLKTSHALVLLSIKSFKVIKCG